MLRVRLNPSLAPDASGDRVESVSTAEKFKAVASCLPFGLIIFSVMGFIMFGIATPSEAAATGVLASLITAAYYRRLNFSMVLDV